jgi:hypothetical protein
MLNHQTEQFEAKFGRPPRPDDLLFFDPDADEPQPLSTEKMRAVFRKYYERVGLGELTIRAAEIADMSPPLTGRYPDRGMQRDWDDGVRAAADELGVPAAEAVETIAADTRRLVIASLISHIKNAIEQPAVGTGLVESLSATVAAVAPDADRIPDDAPGDIGSHAFAEFLIDSGPGVVAPSLTADAVARAREFARVWGDLDLVQAVDEIVATSDEDLEFEWEEVPAALCLLAGITASLGAEKEG